MKIVEHRRPAPEKVLPQGGHVAIKQLQGAGLHEIDPRILEQARVVTRQDDGIFDLNRGRRFHAPRQVLFGGGRVDKPRLSGEVLGDLRTFRDVVVFDADKPPLQARVSIVGGGRSLRLDARLQRGRQRQEQQHGGDQAETGASRPHAVGHGPSNRTGRASRPAFHDLEQQILRAAVGGRDLSAASVCFLASSFLPILK